MGAPGIEHRGVAGGVTKGDEALVNQLHGDWTGPKVATWAGVIPSLRHRREWYAPADVVTPAVSAMRGNAPLIQIEIQRRDEWAMRDLNPPTSRV